MRRSLHLVPATLALTCIVAQDSAFVSRSRDAHATREIPDGYRKFRHQLSGPGPAVRLAHVRADYSAAAYAAAHRGDERVPAVPHRGHHRGRAGTVTSRNAGLPATFHRRR